MAAEKKKPDDENVTRERAHVSEKTCSRSAFASYSRRPEAIGAVAAVVQPRPESPPVRSQTAGYRHERKGAVRDRRSASLTKPKPVRQQPATAAAAAAAGTSAGAAAAAAGTSAEAKATDAAAGTSAGTKTAVASTSAGAAVRRPFIDFTSISEEELMRPIAPPSTQLDDGVEEFPAYVPWKAAYTWPENEEERSENGDKVPCHVCKRCRCSVCQSNCKYLKTTLFGVDVSDQTNETLVNALEHLPCVKRTARCLERNSRTWFRNPFAEKRRYQRTAADRKWPYICTVLSSFLPCLGSYRPLSNTDRCVDNCAGNVRVPGCTCVDWRTMRNGRRVRDMDAAYYAALSSSTAERRRRYQERQKAIEDNARAVKAARTIAAAKQSAAAAVKDEAAGTDAAAAASVSKTDVVDVKTEEVSPPAKPAGEKEKK